MAAIINNVAAKFTISISGLKKLAKVITKLYEEKVFIIAKNKAKNIAKNEEYLALSNEFDPTKFPTLTLAAKPIDRGNIKVKVVTCMAIA